MTPIALGPVLLCYDGSEGARRAIERTGALLPGAETIVLHLWDSPAVGAYAPPAHVGPALHAQAVAIAAEGAELARHAGLRARPLPAGIGVSWESILAVADEHDARLIATGARGMTGARAMLGSISHGVAHHARIPVLVVPPARAAEATGDHRHDDAAPQPAASGAELLVHAVAGLTHSRRTDALARYVILEAGRGRDLTDILDDAYIANRADHATLRALLDRHDVVEALGQDATDGLRARIAALG